VYQRHLQPVWAITHTTGHVSTIANGNGRFAYITSAVLSRCRGVNLMGLAEMSHLGVGESPSRTEVGSIGISTIQLPSRRTSTTRAI